MGIASAFLVAYMTMDLMPNAAAVETTKENTTMMEEGVGDLTVIAVPVEVGTVALGATRIPVLTLEVTASCESPIQIEEITLRHTGRGAASDIDGVYIGADYRRVSRSARIDTTGLVRLRLQKTVVEACDALPLTVYMNLSREAAPAGEHGLRLESSSDISSTAKSVTLASDASTNATVVASPKSNGAITVRFLPVHGLLRYGRNETIARLQLSADSTGSHVLRSITLTNQENARDYDFLDLQLEDTRGAVLTRRQPHMDGRTVTLTFDPTYILEKGQTKVFLLKSKVHASARKKVRFTLEEEADLVASPYRMAR